MIILFFVPHIKVLMSLSYPALPMSRTMRLSIMITLIVAFFVISPAVILYTAGYRYDIGSRRIQQTGVLSIDIKPRDARVYVNDTFLHASLPIRLSHRKAAPYDVRIEKEGYHNWQQTVDIESKQTTYIRNISLFPTLTPRFLGTYQREHDFSLSPDGKYALGVSEHEALYEITAYDIHAQTTRTLLRRVASQAPYVHWSPIHNAAVLLFDEEQSTDLFLYDPKQETSLSPHHISTGAAPAAIQWDMGASHPTVYIQDTTGAILHITQEAIIPLFQTDTSLWHVTPAQSFIASSSSTDRIAYDDQTSYSTHGIDDIIAITDTFLLAHTKQNDIVLIQKNQQGADTRTIFEDGQATWNALTREWILWTPWEVCSLAPDGTHTLLKRTDTAITHITPLNKFGLLLLSFADAHMAFDPVYDTKHTLFTGQQTRDVGFDPARKQISFIGDRSGIFGAYLHQL